MENFFIDENFFYGIDDLITHLDLDDNSAIDELEEDWSIEVEAGIQEPMFVLKAADIEEMLFNNNEDRYSEDSPQSEQIIKALNECVDFEKLNSKIPVLWFGGGEKFTITKADLLEYIK